MKSRTKQSTTEWLRGQLVSRIQDGTYPVGGKLPSVVKLGEIFHVSPTTAFLVVRELAREEWVKCNAGPKGTVVLRQEGKSSSFSRKTLVCLLRPHDNSRSEVDNYGLDILLGVRSEISDRGFRFVYHALDENDYDKRVLELIEHDTVAGVVVDQLTPTAVVGRIAATGIPVVLFNRMLSIENLSVVVPDHGHIGRETVKFLLRQGYDRLAFYPKPEGELLTQERFLPAAEIYQGFRDAVEAEGLSGERAVDIPRVEPNRPEQNRLEEFGLPNRKPRGWQRLGILAPFDTRARQVIEVLAHSDLKLGRDVGVIGCGNLDCNTSRPDPFSTWRTDCGELGREAVRELLCRIAAPSRPRSIIKLPVYFLDRGSA